MNYSPGGLGCQRGFASRKKRIVTLHERIAEALGWSVEEVRRFSFQSLRDMVRTASPKLAWELTCQIRSGSYIVGAPLRPQSKNPSVWE